MKILTMFMVVVLMLAILSVIVSQNSLTAGLVQSIFSTFARLLNIVVSPIGGTVSHTTDFNAPK